MSRQPTYRDYLWTEPGGGHAGAFDSFCLAFIEDADIAEIIAQLPVIEEVGVLTFPDELRFRSYDDWNEAELLVGLLQIDSWTAMFEVNGFAGITPQIVLPLSAGRRIVSHHFSDGNGHGSFVFTKTVDSRRTSAQRSGSTTYRLRTRTRCAH